MSSMLSYNVNSNFRLYEDVDIIAATAFFHQVICVVPLLIKATPLELHTIACLQKVVDIIHANTGYTAAHVAVTLPQLHDALTHEDLKW